MPLLFLIVGLGLFFAILLLTKQFAQADVKVLAARLKRYGGVAALFGAGVLFVTGRVLPAIILATFAFTLMGRSLPFPFGRLGGAGKSQGQSSSVRTPYLEMALDHDTGQMAGRVLRGRFEGRLLSELSQGDLDLLMEELQRADNEGMQLLQAWLERMSPHGAQTKAGGHSRQQSNGQSGGNGGPSRGTMTVEEAYSILNLKPGATREEIQTAHRDLMKRFHPDQGGSTYLASKINEAKALLLKQSPR